MNNDLISREDLKELLKECAYSYDGVNTWIMKDEVLGIIDNAPTVEYTFEKAFQKTVCEQRLYCPERLKGEFTSICTGTCYGRDTFIAEDMKEGDEQ